MASAAAAAVISTATTLWFPFCFRRVGGGTHPRCRSALTVSHIPSVKGRSLYLRQEGRQVGRQARVSVLDSSVAIDPHSTSTYDESRQQKVHFQHARTYPRSRSALRASTRGHQDRKLTMDGATIGSRPRIRAGVAVSRARIARTHSGSTGGR